MDSLLETLSSCTSCTAAISQQPLLFSPLYNCVRCRSSRTRIRRFIQQLGLSSLVHVLFPHVRDWGTQERLDPASMFVVHSLVMSTEESTSQELSCLILKNAWRMLLHAQKSAHDSTLGKLLREAAAAWVRALPLFCCPTNDILKTMSNLMDRSWKTRHPKVRFLQKIGSAVQDTFPGMKCPSTSLIWSNQVLPRKIKRKHDSQADQVADVHLDVHDNRSSRRVASCSSGSTSGGMLLDSLSLDVLGVIFCFLSPPRIMWGCALANKRLLCSCLDNLLWKRIYKAKFPLVRCSRLCLVDLDGADSHDWRSMYMKRRAAAKKVRLKGWKLSTCIKHSKRGKRKRKLGAKKLVVVMCKCCCQCNFVASTKKKMLQHCESEHDSRNDEEAEPEVCIATPRIFY